MCQDGDEAELPDNRGRSAATVLVYGQFALIGGIVLSGPGLRTTALAGGLLASAALAVVLSRPLVGMAIRRIRVPASAR